MPEREEDGAAVPGGAWIRLSRERWEHIEQRHPEMAGYRAEILTTLAEPDCILEGDAGALMAVRQLESGPHAHKYLVVVYRQRTDEDGFVVTAYLARRLKAERRIVWRA